MSSLSTLRDLARQEMKNMDPNGRVWSDSQVDAAVNDGQRRVQLSGNYAWPANSASATVTQVPRGESDLPADFARVRVVKYGASKLDRVEKDDVFGETASGLPAYYYVDGGKMGFSPLPSMAGSVSLLYWKALPTITDLVDCSLPSDFDRAIAKAAAYYLLAGTPRYAQAAAGKLAEYNLELAPLTIRYRFTDDGYSFTATR